MKYFISSILAVFIISGGAVFAEEINEIVVKANKVEEKTQDIKGSLTVFDENLAEDFKIETLQDIAMFTSNFMLYKTGFSGMNSPSIRGMHADHHGSRN